MKKVFLILFSVLLIISCSEAEKSVINFIQVGKNSDGKEVIYNQLDIILYKNLPDKNFSGAYTSLENMGGFHEVATFRNSSNIYIAERLLDDEKSFSHCFYHEYGHYVEDIFFSNLGVKKSQGFSECFAESFAYFCSDLEVTRSCILGVKYCENNNLEITASEIKSVKLLMYFIEQEKEIVSKAKEHLKDVFKSLSKKHQNTNRYRNRKK